MSTLIDSYLKAVAVCIFRSQTGSLMFTKPYKIAFCLEPLKYLSTMTFCIKNAIVNCSTL